MKIVCIYGQNHKGSTYHIAKIPWDNPMGFLKVTWLFVASSPDMHFLCIRD